VFAAAGEGPQFLDRIEPVIAVAVGDLVEPAAGATVADHVEAVEGPEHPLGSGDGRRHFLDRCFS